MPSEKVAYKLQKQQKLSAFLKTTYEEITPELIHQGFMEIVQSPVVHLYFDFDFGTSEQYEAADFKNVFEYMTKETARMCQFFGKVSIAGFSNDEATAKKYKVAFIPEAGKFLSIHAVYYEKYVWFSSLRPLLTSPHCKEFLGFACFDNSVYSANHLFRHACSPKYSDKYVIEMNDVEEYEGHHLRANATGDNREYYGSMAEGLDIRTQLITPEHIDYTDSGDVDFKSPLFVNICAFNNDLFKLIMEEVREQAKKESDNMIKQIELRTDEKAAEGCEIAPEAVEIMADIINKKRGFLINWRQRLNREDRFLSFPFCAALSSIFGYKLANHQAFLHKISSHLTDNTKEHYPEILEAVENAGAANRGILINLMRKLDSERFDKELKSYFFPSRGIDWDDSFSFKDMRTNKNYVKEDGSLNIELILGDLSRLMVVIEGQYQVFITKEYDERSKTFKPKMGDEKSARRLLNSIKLMPFRFVPDVEAVKKLQAEYKKELKEAQAQEKERRQKVKKLAADGETIPDDLNTPIELPVLDLDNCPQVKEFHEKKLWDIYDAGTNKNRFIKKGLRFVSDEKGVFQLFTGWQWRKLEVLDIAKIEHFLNHVKSIICGVKEGEDDKLYQRVLDWIAYPLQNPGKRNNVALVLFGPHGAGKNAFTEIIAKLYGRYAEANITAAEEITGNFNPVREGKVLLVCNELSSVESGKLINFDCLKSAITDETFRMNEKGLPVRTCDNVNNYIFVSNHLDCLKLESGDRRYQVLEASGDKIGDVDYFNKLWRTDEAFYNNLFTFFITRDLSNYQPTQIIETDARKTLLEASMTTYERFCRENMNSLINGVNANDFYNDYFTWAKHAEHIQEKNICKRTTFGAKIKPYCEHKLVRVKVGDKSTREYQYSLNKRCKDAWEKEEQEAKKAEAEN